MQASRLFLSTLAAAGLFGFASLAVAQTTQTTTPGASTSTTTSIPNPNETAAQRMERERMDRERMERERLGTTQGTGSTTQGLGTDRPGLRNDRANTGAAPNQWSTDSRNTANRDASGNLRARADRN